MGWHSKFHRSIIVIVSYSRQSVKPMLSDLMVLKWWPSAVLIFEIQDNNRVNMANKCHRANRSNHCRDMAIFRFF